MNNLKTKAILKALILVAVFVVLATSAVLYVFLSKVQPSDVFDKKVSIIYAQSSQEKTDVVLLDKFDSKNAKNVELREYSSINFTVTKKIKLKEVSFKIKADLDSVEQIGLVLNGKQLQIDNYAVSNKSKIVIECDVSLKKKDVLQIVFSNINQPIGMYNLKIDK